MAVIQLKGIKSTVDVDGINQTFVYNSANTSSEAYFSILNQAIPSVAGPTNTYFELNNNTISGIRLTHTTENGKIKGNLKLQSYQAGNTNIIDHFSINCDDNTFEFLTPVTFNGSVFTGPTNFSKLGIGKTPTVDGRIAFSNNTDYNKIQMSDIINADEFGQSGIGYSQTTGSIYTTPAAKSHRFYVGANGNNPVTIFANRMFIPGIGYSNIDFRKITFYEIADNQNQVLGVGVEINGAAKNLRLQLSQAADSLVVYSGIDANNSRKLFEMSGTGTSTFLNSNKDALITLNNTYSTASNETQTNRVYFKNNYGSGYALSNRTTNQGLGGNYELGRFALEGFNNNTYTADFFDVVYGEKSAGLFYWTQKVRTDFEQETRFLNTIIVPDPTLATHAASKSYVDSYIPRASPSNTTSFLRADGSWSNTITGTCYITEPYGIISADANLSTTTITANVWTKIVTVTSSSYVVDTSIVSTNRITHVGAQTKNYSLLGVITVSRTTNGNLQIAIFKNGTIRQTVTMTNNFSANAVSQLIVCGQASLATNDYVELFITSTNNATATASSLQLQAVAI